MQRHQSRWPWSARAVGVLAQEPLELGAPEEAAVGRRRAAVRGRSRAAPRGTSGRAGRRSPSCRARAISGGRSAANACLSAALPRRERRRQREAELDDAVVEERRAQLERDRHRGDVALREQVAGEVRLDVDEAQVGVVRQQRLRGLRARLVRPERAAELEREHLDQAGVARRRRLRRPTSRKRRARKSVERGSRRAAGTHAERARRRARRAAAGRGRRARGPGSARSRRRPRRRRRRRAPPSRAAASPRRRAASAAPPRRRTARRTPRRGGRAARGPDRPRAPRGCVPKRSATARACGRSS